jgi:hypothetical protein
MGTKPGGKTGSCLGAGDSDEAAMVNGDGDGEDGAWCWSAEFSTVHAVCA